MLSVKGKVNRIIAQNDISKNNSGRELISTTQVLEVIINEGRHTGEKIDVINTYNRDMPYNYLLGKGDEVFLSINEDDRGNLIEDEENGIIVKGHIYEFARGKYVIYLIVFFIVVMGVIGGLKGLKVIFTLFLTVIGIIKILPMFILKGYDPIVVSLVISLAIVIIALTIVNGINNRTVAAIIGSVGGIGISSIIAINIGTLSKLTGLINEEVPMYMTIAQNTELNYKGILLQELLLEL